MKTWAKLRNNTNLWKRYFIREKTLTAIRRFFFDRKFHEVETPYLTGSLIPESYLEIFETKLQFRDGTHKKAYLPPSPEVFMKKLLVAGIGNCFTLPKSFRNTEDKSLNHSPEFTILEWYRVNADYKDIMQDCEELVIFINTYLKRTGNKSASNTMPHSLHYRGQTIDLSPPWERISISSAFRKMAGINEDTLLDEKKLLNIAVKKGYKIGKRNTWEEAFHQIYLNEIEPFLGKKKPTIIYDYPLAMASLSKKKKKDPRFAERFELYIAGLELGNAFSELSDWKEQLARFKKETELRKTNNKIPHPIDVDFIEALKKGMPQAGGIAVGVDRLIMLFSNVTDIADTQFFPAKELF